MDKVSYSLRKGSAQRHLNCNVEKDDKNCLAKFQGKTSELKSSDNFFLKILLSKMNVSVYLQLIKCFTSQTFNKCSMLKNANAIVKLSVKELWLLINEKEIKSTADADLT